MEQAVEPGLVHHPTVAVGGLGAQQRVELSGHFDHRLATRLQYVARNAMHALRLLVPMGPVWQRPDQRAVLLPAAQDRKSTRLNSSHGYISYAVFCLKKKKKK